MEIHLGRETYFISTDVLTYILEFLDADDYKSLIFVSKNIKYAFQKTCFFVTIQLLPRTTLDQLLRLHITDKYIYFFKHSGQIVEKIGRWELFARFVKRGCIILVQYLNLLDKGVFVKYKKIRSTPFAIGDEILINQPTPDLDTHEWLHWIIGGFNLSCKYGHSDLAIYIHTILRNNNIHVNYSNALKFACESGCLKLIQWICEFPSINHRQLESGFYICCLYGYLDPAIWIYIFADIADSSMAFVIKNYGFYLACKNGHLHVAMHLYTLGGINIHCKQDQAFRRACSGGHPEMSKWLYKLMREEKTFESFIKIPVWWMLVQLSVIFRFMINLSGLGRQSIGV